LASVGGAFDDQAPEASYRLSLGYNSLVNSPAVVIIADDVENCRPRHHGPLHRGRRRCELLENLRLGPAVFSLMNQ
jgi:hypothetical protein